MGTYIYLTGSMTFLPLRYVCILFSRLIGLQLRLHVLSQGCKLLTSNVLLPIAIC
jgi:hypothetical protein